VRRPGQPSKGPTEEASKRTSLKPPFNPCYSIPYKPSRPRQSFTVRESMTLRSKGPTKEGEQTLPSLSIPLTPIRVCPFKARRSTTLWSKKRPTKEASNLKAPLSTHQSIMCSPVDHPEQRDLLRKRVISKPPFQPLRIPIRAPFVPPNPSGEKEAYLYTH